MTRAAVVGIGYSTIGGDTGVDSGPLAVQAARAAIADAGLSIGDVDAVFEYGG